VLSTLVGVLSETPERPTPKRPQSADLATGQGADRAPAEGDEAVPGGEAAGGPGDDEEFSLDLLTIAEWALIGPDGRVTLGNAMTTVVQLQALPGGLPPLHLVASVAAPATWAGHQAALTVRAVNAEGRPVAADPLVSGTASFPAGAEGTVSSPRLQFALQITGLPVQSPGRLRFILSLAGDELGEVALDVRRAPPPTPA
jgi:hypothetical protein